MYPILLVRPPRPLTRNDVLTYHLSRPGRFRPLLKYFVKSDGLSVGGLDAEPLRPNSTHLWAYQLAGSDHGLSFPTTFPGASGGASFAWLDVLRTVYSPYAAYLACAMMVATSAS